MLKNVSAEIIQHRIMLKRAKDQFSQYKGGEILLAARMIRLLRLTKQSLRISDSSLDTVSVIKDAENDKASRLRRCCWI